MQFLTHFEHCIILMSICISNHHHRERTNIEVRVEIETHLRGTRQSSLCSILSSRSLSAESLGHSKSLSQDYLCASQVQERGEKGAEGGEEQDKTREKLGGEAGTDGGTVWPVFEIKYV